VVNEFPFFEDSAVGRKNPQVQESFVDPIRWHILASSAITAARTAPIFRIECEESPRQGLSENWTARGFASILH